MLPALNSVPSPNYSSRGGAKVRLIVVHDCEGSYAGSVSWFAMRRSRVSAHVVLSEDGECATQMVAWGNKAWHVCKFNSIAEGIEAAGYSAKGLGEPEWEALAEIVAFRLHARGLPCQWAGRPALEKGFCQHADLGIAGGGHHDITHDADVWEHFCRLVQKAYNQPQPAQWVSQGQIAKFSSFDFPPGFIPSGTQRHDFEVGSIEWVQMELNARHISVQPLIVDGIEGPDTTAALMTFQRAMGLTIDGVIGPETIAALNSGN